MQASVPRRHAADPAGRPGHAHRHGRRRGVSMAAGTNAAELDFDSVQRGNPRSSAARRRSSTTAGRWAATRSSPSTTSARAASVQRLPRAGGRRGPRRVSTCKVPLEESGLATARSGATRARSATCWRAPEALPLFRRCERERCPFASSAWPPMRGSAGARRTRQRRQADRHADGGAARQAAAMQRDVKRAARGLTRFAAARPTCALEKVAAFDVLRHPTVADKTLPHHHRRPHRRRPGSPRPDGRPLAGAGGRLRGDAGRLRRFRRRGDGMGERTPLARSMRRPGRMAVGEAITNLPRRRSNCRDVKLSLQLDGGLRRSRRRRGALRHREGRGHGAVPGAGHQRAGGQGFAVDAHALEPGWAARQGHRAGEPDRLGLRRRSATCGPR